VTIQTILGESVSLSDASVALLLEQAVALRDLARGDAENYNALMGGSRALLATIGYHWGRHSPEPFRFADFPDRVPHAS
jgi:hypothetical protein